MNRMIGLVCVLLGFGLCGSSMAATSVWTSAVSGNFSDGAKWTGGVPGPADEADFTASGNYTVTWMGDVANKNAVISWTTTGKTLIEQIGAYTWALTNGFNIGTNASDRCQVLQASGNLAVTNVAGTSTFNVGNIGQTTYMLTNGTIIADIARVGYSGQAKNNMLTIGTNGSLTFKSGQIDVGCSGGADGNSLVITNGGKVYHPGGQLDVGNNCAGNSIVVSGTGSRLERSSSTTFYLGMNGGGFNNQLTISNGGYMTNAAQLRLAYGATTATSNIVLVAGSNSIYVTSGGVMLGDKGNFNQIIVTNGGRFTSLSTGAADAGVGGDNGGGGNRLLVTDTNSLWESYCLNLGRSYGAGMNVSNQIEVANGGRMTISASLIIATGNKSSNCLMSVYGPGSLVTVGDSLTLGENVPGWNLLTVSNSATLAVATNLYVGQYSSATTDNTLRVYNANVIVTNAAATGALNLWRGGLTIQGSSGTITADKFDMTGGSAVCTLSYVADSQGVTKVKVNGALTVSSSSKLSLDLTNLILPGSYVLAEYGTMATPFNTGNIIVTGINRAYRIDQTTGNKITLIIPAVGTTISIH